MSVDGEVVELDHGIRLGPEADLPGLLEGVIRPVEDAVAVEEDHESVARGLDPHRVPGVRRDLQVLVAELPPAAIDHVIDAAVVFQGIATGDVVIVGVPVAPHQAETLIHVAGERARADAQRHVLVRSVLEDGDGKAIVGRVGALLDEDVVLVRSLFGAHDPLALRAATRPRELEAGRRLSNGIRLEVSLYRVGGRGQAKEGRDEEYEPGRMFHGRGDAVLAGAAEPVTSSAARRPWASDAAGPIPQ